MRRTPRRTRKKQDTGRTALITGAAAAVFVLSIERLFFDFPDWVWWVVGGLAIVVFLSGLGSSFRWLGERVPRLYMPRRWHHYRELAEYENEVESRTGNSIRVLDTPTIAENHLDEHDPWLESHVNLFNGTPWDLAVATLSGSAKVSNRNRLSRDAEYVSGGADLKRTSTDGVRIRQSVNSDTAGYIKDQNDTGALSIQLGEITVTYTRADDGHEFRVPLAAPPIRQL